MNQKERDKKILVEFENFLYNTKSKAKKTPAQKTLEKDTADDFGNVTNVTPIPIVKEETLIEKSLEFLNRIHKK